MAKERLSVWPTGDEEFGAEMQITKSAILPTKRAATVFVPSQALTVSTSVVTLPTPTGKTYAYITVATDKVRFRFGADPSSTVGHELAAGDSLELESDSEILNARFIRSGAADATLTISYGEKVSE